MYPRGKVAMLVLDENQTSSLHLVCSLWKRAFGLAYILWNMFMTDSNGQFASSWPGGWKLKMKIFLIQFLPSLMYLTSISNRLHKASSQLLSSWIAKENVVSWIIIRSKVSHTCR